jgi:hypothetical protein
MRQARPFRLYKDGALIRQELYRLGAGDSLTVEAPNLSNRAVLYIEAEQDSLNPYQQLATAEATCGNVPTSSERFGFADNGVSEVTQCLVVRDSYDPHDIAVTPKGLGDQGKILEGTLLDYRIRFVNKGNDTAYNVYVIDTLSEFLDVATLDFGIASHKVTTQVYGEGVTVLRWDFKDIYLVDSITNSDSARGFLHFRIRTKRPLPVGTRITNNADIYFDFNDPVRTNTVLNTIFIPEIDTANRDSIRIVSINPQVKLGPKVTVSPNPNKGSFAVACSEPAIIEIIDLHGAVVFKQSGKQGRNAINLLGKAPGLYFIRVKGALGMTMTKVIIQ